MVKKGLLVSACIAILFASSAFAYDSQIVKGENFSYQFDIYSPEESIDYGGLTTSAFEINSDYVNAFFAASKTWASIVDSNVDKPIRYAVLSFNKYNASAGSLPVQVAEHSYFLTGANAAINNLTVKKTYSDEPIDGIIFLGLGIIKEHPGWAPFTGYHPLYHGKIADLNVVILHELMHSFGVTSYAAGDKETIEVIGYIPYSVYDKNLRIYTGSPSEPFDSNKEFSYQKGTKAGDETSDFDVINNSPYLAGKETIKVLGSQNTYAIAKQAIINNGGLVNYSGKYDANNRPNVYGMPLHPADGHNVNLSHLELRNSFMSHQSYRNWLIPMEAELAVLKDIGYDIDLRKYFGRSYYLNGMTDTYTEGFGAWNGTQYTGNSSEIIQAVGLHIYGDENNITQASDILTNGEGSFGVRIDGVGNSYTLKNGTSIRSTGKENIALGATWGNAHIINLENGATIQATGEDGIAVSFDFGDNILGAYDAARGSFIYFDGKSNLAPDKTTQDALVKEFNVSGTLEGRKAAIYISDNAWVDNINIKEGASIKGDIISEWNSVSTPYDAKVMIQDGETSEHPSYRPRDINNPAEMLNTNLNFSGESMIAGNIMGENGINNTLIMNNMGTINFDGNIIAVKALENTGIININKKVDILSNDGKLMGNGTIKVNTNGCLSLSRGLNRIENTIVFNGGGINLANGEVEDIKFGGLILNNKVDATLDVDLASMASDKLVFNDKDDIITNGNIVEITNINLLNSHVDLTQEKYVIPFVGSAYHSENLVDNIHTNINQELMTPVYKYILDYQNDEIEGNIVISRSDTGSPGDYNPSVYSSSIVAQTASFTQESIANTVFSKIMSQSRSQGRSGGDKSKTDNAWISVIGYDDDVNFKHFSTVISKMYSFVGGFNTDQIAIGSGEVSFGIYTGYLNGKQEYNGTKIEQEGGYFGLSSLYEQNNYEMAVTLNTGFIKNDGQHVFGNDKYHSYWIGAGIKSGYNCYLGNDLILQPNVQLGYTMVSTENYTIKTGVKFKNDNLYMWEVAPALKLSKYFPKGWNSFAQIKYVFIEDTGGEIKANNIILPNISPENYGEYSIGMEKVLDDILGISMKLNRRSGGRKGWSSDLTLKYYF